MTARKRWLVLALMLLSSGVSFGQDCPNLTTLRELACPAGASGSECTTKGSTLTHAELDANMKNVVSMCVGDTLAGNPAYTAFRCAWATTGMICEGATADTFETLLAVTDPTGDRTITLPDASGTVALIEGDLGAGSQVTDDSHAHTASTISGLDAGDTTTGTFDPARLPAATTSAQGAVVLATDGETTAGEAVQGSDARLIDIVRGPASVTSGATTIFDGTTGKLVKAGSFLDNGSGELSRTGVATLSATTGVNVAGGTVDIAGNGSGNGVNIVGNDYVSLDGGGSGIFLGGSGASLVSYGTMEAINPNSSAFNLPQSTTATQTAEGSLRWDTDDDRIAVGDGAATKLFYPGAHAGASSDGGAALTGDSATSFFASGTFEDGLVDGSLEADEVNPTLGSQTQGPYVSSATANQGLVLTGTEAGSLGLFDCAPNEIPKRNAGDTAWECATDQTGAGGGDAITVNASAATDPDFQNGDIDWTLSGGNVITATVACSGCVDATDVAGLDAGDTTTGSFADARIDGSLEADEVAIGGDGSGTAAALVVTDDSHAHTSGTISGLDISADTNLAAGLGTVLTGDSVDFDTTSTLAGDLALGTEECEFTKDGSGSGGFLCEGTTANANEQLYLFPAADGADTTLTLAMIEGDLVAGSQVSDDSHSHGASTISALDAGDTTTGTFGDARVDGSLEADEVNPTLGTQTQGDYVDNVTAGVGIAVTGSAGEGWEPAVALTFADAGTDPALGAAGATFSSEGASAAGLVFEGDTNDAFETRLRITDPTAERIVTIPNADSTTVQSDAGAANNFLTAISSSGVISKAQPSFTNISGTAGDAQVDGSLEAGEIDIDNLAGLSDVGAAVTKTTADLTVSGVEVDFEAGASEGFPRLAQSTTPPTGDCDGAAEEGRLYWDTDATSGQRLRGCEGTGGWVSIGGGGGSITVEEADASPTVSSVSKIQFDQADGFTVTDETGGQVQVDLAAIPDSVLATSYSGTGTCTNQFARVLNDAAAPTCATVDVSADTNLSASTGLVQSGDAVALKYTDTQAGNPALNAEECEFTTDGTGGGILCEGSSADTNEGLLVWAPTTDKVITLPDATGTVALIEGDLAAGSVVAANSVALTTDTTGNYAAGDAEAGAALTGDSPTNFFSGSTLKLAGRQSLWIPAATMIGRATTPADCAAVFDSGSNDITIRVCNFDQTTSEFAQFQIKMPTGWDEGTLTFVPVWTSTAGSGTFIANLACVAISNDDPLNTTFGTLQSSTDTLLATGDQHTGPESAAITCGGTPAENDYVAFQVSRDVADTIANDVALLGITLYYTDNAATE